MTEHNNPSTRNSLRAKGGVDTQGFPGAVPTETPVESCCILSLKPSNHRRPDSDYEGWKGGKSTCGSVGCRGRSWGHSTPLLGVLQFRSTRSTPKIHRVGVREGSSLVTHRLPTPNPWERRGRGVRGGVRRVVGVVGHYRLRGGRRGRGVSGTGVPRRESVPRLTREENLGPQSQLLTNRRKRKEFLGILSVD